MSETCKQNEASSNADLDLDELEGVAGGSIYDFMVKCTRCGADVSYPTWKANHGHCDACASGVYPSYGDDDE